MKLKRVLTVGAFCLGGIFIFKNLPEFPHQERPKPETHYQNRADLRFVGGYQRCQIQDLDNDQVADCVSLSHDSLGVYDVAFIAPGYESIYNHDALRKLPLDEVMRNQSTGVLNTQNYLQFNIETSLWEADNKEGKN